jgi:6,7-dimethyl-8-ribityllumazine synthase
MSLRIAVLHSTYHTEIMSGLLSGARAELKEQGIRDWKEFQAPGAFEIPLLAKKLASTGNFDGVVCLGCVIKGDTAHFEFISLAAAMGIQQASLETGVPIGFGVLTTYTEEQAVSRSREDPENKGREAVKAVLASARFLHTLK